MKLLILGLGYFMPVHAYRTSLPQYLNHQPNFL